MIRRLICYVQFCVVLLGVSPNLLQPEYSIKILNTENIVLSLGNTDVHDESDLEMIENASENVEVDNKLINFHKYVESVIITERPPEKLNTSLPLIHFLAEAENNKCKNKTERVKKKKSKWLKKLKNRQKFWRNNWVVGKRELTTPENEEEEVTADFEKEYHDFVEEARKNNSIYKYTDEGET